MVDVFEEISRLKQKMISLAMIGTIVETKAKDGKALARVNLLDRVTDFLPVSSLSNSFVKVWIPPLVGEQVLVISSFGDANGGVVIPSIFNKSCLEPSGASENNVIVEVGGSRFESNGSVTKIKSPAKVLLDTPLVETTGDLKVAGDINDSRGDLTGHSHDTTDGAKANPR